MKGIQGQQGVQGPQGLPGAQGLQGVCICSNLFFSWEFDQLIWLYRSKEFRELQVLQELVQLEGKVLLTVTSSEMLIARSVGPTGPQGIAGSQVDMLVHCLSTLKLINGRVFKDFKALRYTTQKDHHNDVLIKKREFRVCRDHRELLGRNLHM